MKGYRLQFRMIFRLIILMYITTFCIILPVLCWNLAFSRYYFESSRTVEGAILDDVTQGQRADEYFARLSSGSSLAFHAEALKQGRPKFAIGIITVKRSSVKHKNYGPRYLSRVVAEFDKLLKKFNRRDIILFICNAQNVPHEHKEARNLTKYVHVVSKSKTDRHHASFNTREKEKRDYVFCMSQIETFNADYSILVQDDALPSPHFTTSLDRLLDTRIEHRLRHGLRQPNPESWAAVKFYFPEKWQGYGYETFLIIELIASAVFGGGALYGLSRLLCTSHLNWIQTFSVFVLFCFYVGLSIFVIGRPYLMMFRLISVDLFSIRGAPECCIPAVLYKTESLPHIRDHLRGIVCSERYPLDIAISKFLQSVGEKQYLIMPNLFNHIGMFSSLHSQINSPHLFWG